MPILSISLDNLSAKSFSNSEVAISSVALSNSLSASASSSGVVAGAALSSPECMTSDLDDLSPIGLVCPLGSEPYISWIISKKSPEG